MSVSVGLWVCGSVGLVLCYTYMYPSVVSVGLDQYVLLEDQ